MRAAIVGIAGTGLRAEEAGFLRALAPAGVILFARNVADPVQLRGLTARLRAVLPAGAVVMVDQEGGRVARLRPPNWRAHPPAAALGTAFAASPARGLRAAFLQGALIGLDATAAGFDLVAAPVLDRRVPGAHDVIGDRALSEEPAAIARLGRALAAGLLAAGVQPVMKHLPGHGRARADSHAALPTVDAAAAEADLAPFAANADLPWAMSAHILYTGWDAARPATLSPGVIGGIIRCRLGFKGLLLTDDLAMHALTGTPTERALAALEAGCDIALYCTGEPGPTEALLEACPALSPRAARLMADARAMAAARRVPLDATALAAERDRLLA
jgi:beta-N-acetylhexosaminidase